MFGIKALSRKLDVAIALLRILTKQGRITMKELEDLTAAVTANTTVEQSAATLITGLAGQVQALADAAKTAGTGVDPAAVETLAQQLNTSATALSAAITANTPAAQ